MKRYRILLGLFLALTIAGCEDFLDADPYSLVTSQNMWRNEAEAMAGIAGMYSQFRSTFNDFDFLIYFELRSGFWQTGTSGANQWDDLFLNTPNASSTPSLDWTPFYKTINAANLGIKYIPGIDFGNEDTKDNLLADAYFVRAFCYFQMARIWGDVPLVILPYESADDENLYPTRDDMEVVMAQVKEDIDMAYDHMVDLGVRNRVMASRAAINMLKADVYLWTAKRMGGGNADLLEAEAAVDEVLADPNYQLLPSYEQVFRIEQNSEIIFSIYFDILEASNQYGMRFMLPPGDIESQYWNNPVPVSSNAQWLTYVDDYVNNYLLATPGDTRSEVVNTDFQPGTVLYRWVNKYIGEWVNEARNDVTDTRIYRFAEAILFKAEILNALGSTPEAIIELNKIAKRAYGVDDFYANTLTQEEVDDAILHERLIEFGAEGKSWYDIIRFGKAFEMIPTLVGRENEYEGNILLLPVSPNTITKNPNIVQTPGF
ncbi:MAG: RagB/SusD family nutrient uptake outer membrane protein [Deltaproteobacteria bacterium]|nr:RagB/SusD family nutrient uptake outer membrane protein [Deltaproteobacteria bacterium]